MSGPDVIVGLRARIHRKHAVQRALIQRPPYGDKPCGEFQTDD